MSALEDLGAALGSVLGLVAQAKDEIDSLRARAEEAKRERDGQQARAVHWIKSYRKQLERAIAAESRLRRVEGAARDLDELLLRFAFDAGALGDEKVSELGVDPWGTLKDFREAFGFEPTMTPEEWVRRASAPPPPEAAGE